MASGSVQSINTTAFEDALNKIDKAISTFSATKDSIISSSDALLATWTGKGKRAFNDAYTRLRRELLDEEENLKTIYDDLLSMKQSYEDWDAAAKDSIAENVQ